MEIKIIPNQGVESALGSFYESVIRHDISYEGMRYINLNRASLHNSLPSSESTFWIIALNSMYSPIGYLALYPSTNGIYTLAIAVSRSYREMGVASKLLEALLVKNTSLLEEYEVSNIVCVVNTDNEAAINLFEKFKFNSFKSCTFLSYVYSI